GGSAQRGPYGEGGIQAIRKHSIKIENTNLPARLDLRRSVVGPAGDTPKGWLPAGDAPSVAEALVPLATDDKSRRIGAKVIRSAHVLSEPTAPRVRTAPERAVAEAAGLTRAPSTGALERIDDHMVILWPE